jgi:hypothetical protein
MKKKAIVFDAGTLINLSMNGLLYLLPRLKEKFQGKFLITSKVKYEILDCPIGIPRFELGALRLKSLIDQKVLEMPSSLGIRESEISRKTKYYMDIANHAIQKKGRWIKTISFGEASCLALASELKSRKISCLIAIDERTTRILAEKPENLEKIMERKLHQNVELKIPAKEFKSFSQFQFIRSSELVYVAHKLDLLEIKSQKALEAALYATKYKGSSISFEEIDILKKL